MSKDEKVKYTAGPWEAYAWDIVKFGEDGRNICQISAPPQANDNTVKHIEPRWSKIDEETKANAHLIAAAPELLEALQDMYTEYRAIYPQDATTRLLEKAWRAISKATGQAERVSA
jgi:hypothetical protein